MSIPLRQLAAAAFVSLPCMGVHAAGCVQDTLAVYTAANFDCSIGDLTFSAFAYDSLGNVAIPAAQIQVKPINGAMKGIEFFAPGPFTVAGMNMLFNGTFGYLITVANNGRAINGITLTQLGGQVIGPSGAENVTKNYCATGGPLDNCPPPSGGVLPGFRSLTVYPGADTSSASFAALTKIGISDVLLLRTGNDNISSAHVSALQNLVSQVPEPGTGLMLAAGLAGLCAGRRVLRRG